MKIFSQPINSSQIFLKSFSLLGASFLILFNVLRMKASIPSESIEPVTGALNWSTPSNLLIGSCLFDHRVLIGLGLDVIPSYLKQPKKLLEPANQLKIWTKTYMHVLLIILLIRRKRLSSKLPTLP